MMTSELITTHHLTRKAVIYIRQSTPHQVLSHQESLRLQYALRQRAISLGWRESEIETIDADLGLTATSIQHREGFQRLFARVSLGEIGIILSIEVMRLCRNCSDWYPLLDICGCKGCLIADNDGIYDPGSPNGRLLLGLKGQLSELELHLLRSRLTAGLLNKAHRGELALTLPVGLVRDAQEIVQKDPHQEVQQRLELIFSTFLRLNSASKVLQYLKAHHLTIPRRNRHGELIWKTPTIAAILSILKNPAYAGAFVYGRTRALAQRTPSGKKTQKSLPMEQWKIVVKDKYPAYISWEMFERIQSRLHDNYLLYTRHTARGVPREGAALLQGLVYCGACGHKMVVQYKHSTRYICNYLRQQYHVPVCQYIPAVPLDAQVLQAFFEALSPLELDVYQQVLNMSQREAEQVDRAYQLQVQRLRYQTTVAQRQFDQVDPENRLVAAELERRWEKTLRDLKQAEEAYGRYQSQQSRLPSLPPDLQITFQAIGQKLPDIWHTTLLTRSQKKALVRCLIEKVVVHRAVRDQLHTRIVWKGGLTTTLEIPIAVNSLRELSAAAALEHEILGLARQGVTDEEIAARLTSKGYRSPTQLSVLPNTVKIVRLKHRVFHTPHQSHPRRIPGALTVPQLALQLGVPKHWLHDRIRHGKIRITKDPHTRLYLFPDIPATLEQLRQLQRGDLSHVDVPPLAGAHGTHPDAAAQSSPAIDMQDDRPPS